MTCPETVYFTFFETGYPMFASQVAFPEYSLVLPVIGKRNKFQLAEKVHFYTELTLRQYDCYIRLAFFSTTHKSRLWMPISALP
jgi:hypothetical protein